MTSALVCSPVRAQGVAAQSWASPGPRWVTGQLLPGPPTRRHVWLPPAPGTEDSGAGGCRSRGPPPHLGPLPPPRASSPRMEWSALVTGEEGETRSESRDVARGLAGKGKEKGQGQTARVSEQRRLAGRQEEGGHGERRGEGELPQPLWFPGSTVTEGTHARGPNAGPGPQDLPLLSPQGATPRALSLKHLGAMAFCLGN